MAETRATKLMTPRIARQQTQRWQHTYRRRLVVTDGAIVLATVIVAQVLRFGLEGESARVRPDEILTFAVSYTLLSLGIAVVWMSALAVVNSTAVPVIGTGFTEYKRVADATVWTFGVLAITSLLLRMDIARGYLLVAFPLGLFLLLMARWLWRRWLHAGRRRGDYLHRAIIIGEFTKVLHVAREIARESHAGLQIVGAVTNTEGTESEGHTECDGLGLLYTSEPGSIGPILGAVEHGAADTLIMTSTHTLSPATLRRLGWAMEERQVDLIVAPALTDIAGPRISSRPVAGLPLIHIEYPRLSGSRYWTKRIFDICGATILVILLSPVLLIVAATVKFTSAGPILFKQQRTGKDGTPFRMLKFRSMRLNAEQELQALLHTQGTADKPLFKIVNDPRITPVGQFLRKYSLDELPQIFNVLGGSMSLVGPRPQIEAEVALYDDAAVRRLTVSPGLTGLWQVSGRSDLSWEDSIRLDLYYVDNWSLMQDISLIFRTIRVVLFPRGAY